MSIRGKACIAGIHEHPTRKADGLSLAQIHAEVARGALADAGLGKDDVDGYFCAGDAPGLGPMNMVEYLNLKPRHVDSTDTGGSAYVLAVGHAAAAIALAGAGPDRTELEIWTDPAVERNTHRVVVEADTARIEVAIANVPSDENPGTGRITALSMLAALDRLSNPLVVGT